MVKRNSFLPLALVLLVSVCAVYAAQPKLELRLLKGPYLQNVTRTSMVLMWETDQPSDSRVDFGQTADYASRAIDPALSTIHTVTLLGLQADTRYHYRVSSTREGQTISSGDNSFQTAVAASTPFRFAVYGDSRSFPKDHAQVIEGIIDSHPRFVIHTGDFVSDGNEYDQWQRDYFDPSQPLLRTTPMYPCLGNHEQDAEWYYCFFSPPSGGGRHDKQWYSFDYGEAHFAVIDTDVDFSPASEQYKWLRADLQSSHAEWLFVVHHHPAFSSGSHGGDKKVQQYLVPLYEQYRADVVFNGHDHLYERSHKDGVYYIVTGGGGAPLYPARKTPNPNRQVSNMAHHFCTVDIGGETTTLRACGEGVVFDALVLRHPAGFARQ